MQDVLHERDVAVARSGRVDDLEETVSELRRHNKELENQVGNLSMCNTADRHRGQKMPLLDRFCPLVDYRYGRTESGTNNDASGMHVGRARC